MEGSAQVACYIPTKASRYPACDGAAVLHNKHNYAVAQQRFL
jgi:hypothetical protein